MNKTIDLISSYYHSTQLTPVMKGFFHLKPVMTEISTNLENQRAVL